MFLGLLTLAATSINWNLIIPIFAVCVSALVAVIKIFGDKPKQENLPGNALHCKQHEKEFSELKKTVEDGTKTNYEEHNDMRNTMSEIKQHIASLEADTKNNTRSLEDARRDNREIVKRLDNLLKDLMEWLSE